MANFIFEMQNLRDPESFAKAFNANTQNRNPDGGALLALGTTQSRDTNPQVSMTTYNMSEIMQGSAITKPEIAPYDAFNQILSKSLSEMLGDPKANPDTVLGNQKVLVPDDVLRVAGTTGAALTNSTTGGVAPNNGSANASDPAAPNSNIANAESAIAWMQARAGDISLDGMCELAVEMSFGTRGRFPAAISNWRSRPDQHIDSNPPRGALVFWNTNQFGHVGISLGGGKVISTSSNQFRGNGTHGRGIGESPVTGFFQNYLGWSGNSF